MELMRLKLAVIVLGLLAAIAVTGSSAADFEVDKGPCPEPPGGGPVLLCPTGYVGVPYEIELESEEGSGCTPYVWYEIVNSSLPAGLSMSRDGVISGVPTRADFVRFWVWNHDLTAAQGGPSWCAREDRSEKEFSIPIDPGLSIVKESVKPATVGQPYTETLTTRRVYTLNPPTGPNVQATWSLASGALPPGITLSAGGALSGTPTSEGSYAFDVKAQNGGPFDTETYTLAVRQPVLVKASLGATERPSAEVGIRFGKAATATGGTGTYTWSLTSGALPAGVALDATKGTISGTPQRAGNFAFALTATDTEGRLATANASMTVASSLTIKTLRLKTARLARTYQARLVPVGGVQPLKWRVSRGKLPLGIRLSRSLGTLAGTPRRTGPFRVTVEARDALGAKSQRTLVLLVRN
jgi:large repetitive protein